MNRRVHKMKKKSVYELLSAVFNKLWQYSPKACLELRSLLEGKYKLLAMLFSFRFCLCIYLPSCPTTRAWLPPEILTNQYRTENRPSSALFQHSDTAVESYRLDTAGQKSQRVNVSISKACTTAESSTGRRPDVAVDRSGATRQPCGKFPAGQTTVSCDYAYAFLCSTTLSGEKRNLPAERKPEHVNEALLPIYANILQRAQSAHLWTPWYELCMVR